LTKACIILHSYKLKPYTS